VDTWQGSCTELLKSFVQAWREIARCGVVHGSLKPSAIRFEDRSIKVKNFECARVVTGQFIAPKSYAYSAPEVLGAQTISKSDVFSLGLIIYKLAYGKLPYSEEISFGELKEFWAKTTQIEIK
jgi:serine/threonine protein kinase